MRSAALVLALALAACGGKHAASPHPTVPALLASVPADTPYVVASLEAIPLDVMATYRDAIGGLLRSKLEHPGGEAPAASEAYGRLVAALLAELDGKWTAAGMESLGLSATPRFALYGLGLDPVARIEIRDGKLLLGTIERIARRAQIDLPRPEARDGRTVWRIVERDRAFVVAIAADQLVLAYLPSAGLEAQLPLVLGTRKPTRTMADGAALVAARDRYHLGGHAIAIVDTRQLAGRLLAGARPAPACTAEIDRLAARVPHVFGGYAISRTEQDAALVVELAPDLLGELRALRVELPGVAEARANAPLLMLGAGIELPRAQALAVAAGRAIQRAATACGNATHAKGAGELVAAAEQPIPQPFSQLRGAVVSIKTIAIPGPLPLPTELEGFALVSSPSAAALFDLARAAVSQLLPVPFGADGKLHPLPQDQLPLTLPFPLFAGASQRAIVLAAGAQGREAAERALAAPPAPSPLFVLDGDYGRISELSSRLGGGEDDGVMAARAKLYGRMRLGLDATERGLELRVAVETKPPGQ